MQQNVVENTDTVSGILEEQKEFNTTFTSGLQWISLLRKAGVENFKKLGIPSLKNEEWKYTRVSKYLSDNFTFSNEVENISSDIINSLPITGNDIIKLIYINGKFSKQLSDKFEDDSIAITAGNPPDDNTTIKKYIGKVGAIEKDHFFAMNTAFINEITNISVLSDHKAAKTIHIIHFLGSTTTKVMSFPRTLIHAEVNSEVTVVESFHSVPGSLPSFTASVTEIIEEPESKVVYYKHQDINDDTTLISQTYIDQYRSSRSDTFTLSLNGKFIRNNLFINMREENCHAELHGIYLSDGNQLTDNHTLVNHISPHCYSNELYKGIIGGNSEGVFNGKIFVHRDAQKTNAYQSNMNVLLTDDAQINTKPQLEIYADDVKCSHGATTGQLDEEAMFYLQSRGIGETKARAILITAFAADVMAKIDNANIKELLSHEVNSKLREMSLAVVDAE
jgi:Fe-S cluster assembly protein SufD